MKKLISTLFTWLLSHDEMPYRKQKEFIDSLPEPKSDFQRVYYGERCCHYRRLNLVCLNIIGFLASIVVLMILSVKSVHTEKKDHADLLIINSDNRQGQAYSYNGRLPEDYIANFDKVLTLRLEHFPAFTDGYVNGRALKVWGGMICNRPLSWFTHFRCLINIMAFNKLIRQYSPAAIMNARAEGNYITTINTHLCESYGVEYDCFMHGELMCSSTTAFVRISKMFIWDDHYKDVLEWSRFTASSFESYTPAIYLYEDRKMLRKDNYYFLLYALCGNELDGIEPNLSEKIALLEKFIKAGYKCKIRPHPRWSDYNEIKKLIDGTGISFEDAASISVPESIGEAEYVVGTFSTVLTEAYYLGAKVIIDDISEPELISELEYRKYFLLNKQHLLLSEFITDNNI